MTIQELQERIEAIDAAMAGLEADGASATTAFGQSATFYPLASLRRQRDWLQRQLNQEVMALQGLDGRFGSVTFTPPGGNNV